MPKQKLTRVDNLADIEAALKASPRWGVNRQPELVDFANSLDALPVQAVGVTKSEDKGDTVLVSFARPLSLSEVAHVAAMPFDALESWLNEALLFWWD